MHWPVLTDRVGRAHDHHAGVDHLTAEVRADLAWGALVIAAAVAHEEARVVEADLGGAAVDVVDASSLRAAHPTATHLAVGAVLTHATLRVEDTCAVDALLVVGAVVVSKALGWTRQALLVDAHFVGRARVVVEATGSGHAHVLLAHLTIRALVVAAASDELASTIHARPTLAALAIGGALRHELTGARVVAHEAWAALAVASAFTLVAAHAVVAAAAVAAVVVDDTLRVDALVVLAAHAAVWRRGAVVVLATLHVNEDALASLTLGPGRALRVAAALTDVAA